jgi:two-component system, LytTR family, response regulator LytT
VEINFQSNSDLPANQVQVTVSAQQLTPEVMTLLQQLNQLSTSFNSTLPITVSDRVQMVAIAEIVAIEVVSTGLLIHTTTHQYRTTGTLKEIYQKLPVATFVQVSKSAVVNIDHLEYMETAFSGSMTAFLSSQLKVHVSRKYLPKLKKSLQM